ncbi:hypothetical protein B0H10DRAFT_552702 [Mycena sp. CBHHK59/15]|nr:hypothetical protein B0H10DRAFT_552702 [Mycena sp. CBHHK59/15]
MFTLWTAPSFFTHISVLVSMMLCVGAIPVDSFVPYTYASRRASNMNGVLTLAFRPSNLSFRATTTSGSPPAPLATDFVQTWGPSVFFDWVDHVAYPSANYTKQELCQKIGSQLEPLAVNGFWKDLRGSAKLIAGAAPWVAQAAVKYSRGDQP